MVTAYNRWAWLSHPIFKALFISSNFPFPIVTQCFLYLFLCSANLQSISCPPLLTGYFALTWLPTWKALPPSVTLSMNRLHYIFSRQAVVIFWWAQNISFPGWDGGEPLPQPKRFPPLQLQRQHSEVNVTHKDMNALKNINTVHSLFNGLCSTQLLHETFTQFTQFPLLHNQ